jgi:membrane protease YdiL (CAAX protease family)
VSEGRRLPATARAGTLAGVLLFWVVQLTLLFVADLALADTILLALLLVALPGLALAQVPLVEGAIVERLPAYWGSIATLWLLGAACWLVGTRAGGPAAVGLVALPVAALAVWSVGLTLAGLLTILVFRGVAAAAGVRDSPLLRELLPRTHEEKRVFALLSLAAGVGEELAYRGYALLALAPILGAVGASAVTSAVFGILHGYQGLLGTLRTALMGAVLAWGFLASGSLWPAIVAHVTIDLVAGIALGERLLSAPQSTSRVQPDLQSSES